MADRWQRRIYAEEFSANSILAADTAGQPSALTVASSRLVGRKSTGGISALTGAEVLALTNADNIFQVFNSSDPTKILALDVSGVATGTTRTLTALNVSGVLQPESYASKSVAGAADVTLTATEAASRVQKFTGALTGSINVLFPLTSGRSWVVWNATSGSYTLTVKGATGTGVAVTQGKKALVWTDGTNFYFGQDDTGAAAGDLDSLSDVVLTGIGSGHVLYHNGSNWVNAAPGATSGVQPYDADLDALAALSSTGIAVRTAANTWAQRTVVDAGSGRISVTNPGGVAGNITLDVAEASLSLNSIGGTLGLAKGGTNANLSATSGLLDQATAGAAVVPITMSAALDKIGNTRGSILYRGASGWAIATPGTSGYVWTSNGSGADPGWAAASGGGGSAAWESAGGVFRAITSVIASGDRIKYVSRETDASGAVAHEMDTENAFYGGYSGAFSAPTGSVLTVGANAKQLLHVVGWYSSSVSMQSAMIRFNPYGQSLTNRYGFGVGLFDVNATTFAYIGRSDFQSDGGVRPIQGAYFACQAADCHVIGSNGLGIEYGAQIKLDSPSYSTAGDSCASKSASTNGTLRQFTYDGVDTLVHGDKITTTDATATTAWSETLSDNTAHVVEALIVARRTDSAGRWSGRRRVTVYRAGGGATVEGSVETLGTDISNGITPTVTFDASSNDVRLRVTGESGKTISWRVHIQKVHAN